MDRDRSGESICELFLLSLHHQILIVTPSCFVCLLYQDSDLRLLLHFYYIQRYLAEPCLLFVSLD